MSRMHLHLRLVPPNRTQQCQIVKGTKAGTVAVLVLATLVEETQIKLLETKFHKNLKHKININDICNLINLII